jgi:hypothetical protein
MELSIAALHAKSIEETDAYQAFFFCLLWATQAVSDTHGLLQSL